MNRAEEIEGYFSLRGGEFEDAGTAATELRTALTKLGVSQQDIKRAAISAFEAEMNVIIHAVAGTLHYRILDGQEGEVRISAIDIGPGIEDVDRAMQEGFSTAPEWAREKGWGSGLGLPNIKRNSDSLVIDTVLGEGTTLEIVVHFTKGNVSARGAAGEGKRDS